MGDDSTAALGALRVDEEKLKEHVGEVVRSSVEETLNGLLDAEADSICRAQRYQRSPRASREPGWRAVEWADAIARLRRRSKQRLAAAAKLPRAAAPRTGWARLRRRRRCENGR